MALRIPLAAALAAGLAVLLAAPAARAHGAPPVSFKDAVRGHQSSVTGLEPSLRGISLRILDGDDRLELTNRSGKTVVVLGYREEPYLRFERNAVYRNARSAATYLNRTRFVGEEQAPNLPGSEAQPLWRRVGRAPVYAWHDHRIHWTKPAVPAGVKAEPHRRQRIFDWKVPIQVEGRQVAIQGHLDYVPPGRQNGAMLAVVLTVGGLGIGLALVLLGRRVVGSPTSTEVGAG